MAATPKAPAGLSIERERLTAIADAAWAAWRVWAQEYGEDGHGRVHAAIAAGLLKAFDDAMEALLVAGKRAR